MFYGWRIVGVASLTHSITVGFTFYSYGVFLKALAAEFGGSRFGVSFGLSVMNIVLGLCSPFIGHAIDHRSIKHIICMGGLFMATGFFLASQITALWHFYVILGLFLGVGASMTGGLPGSTLVVNWFVKKRGMALGLSTMGVSLAGVIMAPLATQLIGTIGWRYTFCIFGGAVVCLIIPAAWFIVVNRPEDMGLFPDGESHPPDEVNGGPGAIVPLGPDEEMIEPASHLEWSARGTLKDRRFWTLCVLFGLNFFCMSAILTHLIPHATDLGLTPAKAALIVSCTAGIAMTGKFFFGFTADRIDTRYALWLSITLQATGAFIFLSTSSYPALFLAGGVFGFGMGGIVPLWRMLVGDIFGRHAFGRVTGLMNPSMLPIRIVGVPFAGLVFDRTGSYHIAFRTYLGAYFLAACLVFFLPEGNARSRAEAG